MPEPKGPAKNNFTFLAADPSRLAHWDRNDWLPEARAEKGIDRLDDGATSRNLSLTRARRAGAGDPRTWLKRRGEPPRNRTGNLQIKSLLLCQLS